ncbi:hypothetical protein OH76DRAFT_1223204 [Lentinus brumalis]|uniref:F-box domain-containing protein n=1 Tax=Lentinus brumalis TaxID=2498619 RepID=A0A371DLP7_9APHY|nr:hypothetical protein OH76DRAFT_1223204 [Polyporus brumalis]
MHRALSLQEIVREICAFNAGDLKSLAALARTCRHYHELATQELWKEIESLVPLVKCFPEDSWTVADGELMFTRPLRPKDWQRVLHYSKHVFRIRLRWRKSNCQVHSSALSTLIISRPSAILFPKAHTFIWDQDKLGIEHVGAIIGLLGPHVKHIDISDSDSLQDDCVQRLRDALCLIPRQFPQLEHFGFGKDDDLICRGSPLFPEALLLPRTLSSLTTFRLHQIPTTEDVIYAVASLPNLQTLEITLPFHSTWPAEHTPQAFPSLRRLSLRTAAADYIAFSAIWRFPIVENACLELIDILDQSAVSNIFRCVREQFSATSLRKLEITCADCPDADEALGMESVVRPAHLQHLFVFTALQVLELTMACQYALNDEFYQDVAKSFPRLSTLTIAVCHWCPLDSLPSMAALVPFALHCSLRTLSVPFDGTQELSLEDIRNALPPGRHPSRVTSLEVGYSPLTNPQLVATYLTRLFPALGGKHLIYGSMDSETDGGQERQELWSQADRFLSYFRMVREDERNITTQQLGRTKCTNKGRRKTYANDVNV